VPIVEEGAVLDGRYRVDRVLGQGGMGIVVAATHIALQQRVAVKLLLPGASATPEGVERFVREARAASLIRSEHVVRVFDVGMHQANAPYIAMEYLEGCDLAEFVAKGGALPPAEAAGYVLQACEALAEAHRAGIVHRDLKPSNLFRTERADGSPLIKVLDFGISKLTTGPAAHGALTSTIAILGSPLYMSPEQVRSSKHVDARADVWSLGVVLYELLSRTTPFDGETVTALAVAITNDPPVSLASLRPDLPAGLERVVMRCLEKAPDARWPNVAELAFAVAPFADPEARFSADRCRRILGVAAPQPPAPPLAESAPGGRTADSGWGGTNPAASELLPSRIPGLEKRSSLKWIAVIGAACLAVLVVLVVRFVRATSEPTIATTSASTAPLVDSVTARHEAPVAERTLAAPVSPVVAAPPEAAAVASVRAAEVVRKPGGRPASRTALPPVKSAAPAAIAAPAPTPPREKSID
jgi:eukaryotic-like serine/threonine-protein kinase